MFLKLHMRYAEIRHAYARPDFIQILIFGFLMVLKEHILQYAHI